MREILIKSGFKECQSKEIADIYIINTCTVTHKADKESRYWMAIFHKTNPKARIVVTGCYAEADGPDISFLPGVAHIVKNSDKGRIADILSGFDNAYHAQRTTHNDLFITGFKDHEKAFVNIQDGCENRCSYCKVPLVRGPARSRPLKEVVSEVECLVANGYKEIVLVGICLGAWGSDLEHGAIAREVGIRGPSLTDVLKTIGRIKGDFRIRLSSIEPKYVTDELIEYISGTNRICRHLHVPLQSGDDDILARMKRQYTAGQYRALIDKVRKRIAGVSITTDVLVGFPGESDLNFRNTVGFIKAVLPSRTHIFTFSRRKGTEAYGMGDGLKDDVLKKRYYELNTAALGASYLYRHEFINRKLDVLVEAKRDRKTGMLSGYSDNYIRIHFDGPDELIKRIVPVKVEDASLLYTLGRYGNE